MYELQSIIHRLFLRVILHKLCIIKTNLCIFKYQIVYLQKSLHVTRNRRCHVVDQPNHNDDYGQRLDLPQIIGAAASHILLRRRRQSYSSESKAVVPR